MKNVFSVVIVCVSMMTLFAMAEDQKPFVSEDDVFARMREICQKEGYSPKEILALMAATNPIRLSGAFVNSYLVRDFFPLTGNYIKFDLVGDVLRQIIQKIDKNPTCYQASAEVVKYVTLGARIQRHMDKVFKTKSVGRGGVTPLDENVGALKSECDEQIGLTSAHDRHFEQVAKYYEKLITLLTKRPVVLAEYKLSEIEDQIMREKIAQNSPKSCKEIENMTGIVAYQLSKVDLFIQKELKKAGYSVQ